MKNLELWFRIMSYNLWRRFTRNILAREGDCAIFKFLYLQYPSLLKVPAKNGRNIFNTLIFHGNLEILNFLSHHEKSLNSDLKDSNVQYDAARCQKTGAQVIQKMSDYGFSIQDWLKSDSIGCSSIHIAAEVRDLRNFLKYLEKSEHVSSYLLTKFFRMGLSRIFERYWKSSDQIRSIFWRHVRQNGPRKGFWKQQNSANI